MQCVERGELVLDRDINDYISPLALRNPNFPTVPITARHLLTHRSSLTDDETALDPGIWRTSHTDCPTPLHAYISQRLCPDGKHYEPFVWSPVKGPGEEVWHQYGSQGARDDRAGPFIRPAWDAELEP